MSILQAILLGLIQGLTEFIPISSTAHLILAGKLLNLGQRLTVEQITAFNAVIQFGTLVAVIAYFFRDLHDIALGFITDSLNMVRGQGSVGDSARLGWLVIIGTLPIVIIGFTFKKQIEGVFTKDLRVIAGAMIGLGIILTIAEFVGSRRFDIKSMTWRDALLIGLAQSCALIPGSSRSGTTITAGLFLGLTRETAARFSFIMSIPAIGAAGLLEFVRAYKDLDSSLITAMIIGMVVAGVSGYASIAFLMYYLKSHSTFVFVGYRFALGAAIIALLFFKVVTPS